MTHEEFMEAVFTPPNYKAPLPDDPFETEAYHRFVASMVPHCHCCERNRPCDGILAGGLCDNVQEKEFEDTYEDRDEDEY